jgi:pectate lyase
MKGLNAHQSTDHYLTAAKQFTEGVLREGRDRYRTPPSPLFADGIDPTTKEHLEWRSPDQDAIVISNLACQQNLMRTLVALSHLTGDAGYKDAACAAIRYMFDHYTDRNGLLFWGGHRMIDLRTLEVGGSGNKGLVHELKNVFPYYELLHEVNPDAAARQMTACWNAHIINWETLEINRHGQYDLDLPSPWARPMVEHPPFREANGLSFINIGDDLIYAAATLYRLHAEAGALAWAKHLAREYVRARHPETRLGAYQFTQPRNTGERTSDNDSSKLGDRAKRQFGPEFGTIALEGNILFAHHAHGIYSKNALMQLHIARELGDDGRDFLDWTIAGLQAFARHAYHPETNTCKPLLTDGTDMTGYTLQRNGYYGRAGRVLQPYSAVEFLLPYVRAFLLSGDDAIWATARQIAQGNGLGDLGLKPGKNVHVNAATHSAEPQDLFAVLEVYQATQCDDYLALARVIGQNIIAQRWVDGYFVPTPDVLYARHDAIEPLALLVLHAAITGQSDLMPVFLNGAGGIHGSYELPDGKVIKSMHDEVFYRITRSDAEKYCKN